MGELCVRVCVRGGFTSMRLTLSVQLWSCTTDNVSALRITSRWSCQGKAGGGRVSVSIEYGKEEKVARGVWGGGGTYKHERHELAVRRVSALPAGLLEHIRELHPTPPPQARGGAPQFNGNIYYSAAVFEYQA